MKLLFFLTLLFVIISCGGGSYNNEDIEVEMKTQVESDSSSQNNPADTNKLIQEISTFENAKFDEAIYN